jgi:hypothetical protein
MFSSSSFVLSVHSPFAFCVGPNILLNILLSNTHSFSLIFSVTFDISHCYLLQSSALPSLWKGSSVSTSDETDSFE